MVLSGDRMLLSATSLCKSKSILAPDRWVPCFKNVLVLNGNKALMSTTFVLQFWSILASERWASGSATKRYLLLAFWRLAPILCLSMFSPLAVWDRSVMDLIYVYDFWIVINWGDNMVLDMYNGGVEGISRRNSLWWWL